MIHLLLPEQRHTECARLGLTGTTENVHHVTCKLCLRKYIKRIALAQREHAKKAKAS